MCEGIDALACTGGGDEPPVWYADVDEDGFGSEDDVVSACVRPFGYVDVAGDCDDGNPARRPDATEICDDVDNDCDDSTDEEARFWWPDMDGDGYGAGEPIDSCDEVPDHVERDGDCNELDPDVNPGEAEICHDGSRQRLRREQQPLRPVWHPGPLLRWQT